jgi:capsular exopolysaccharide synthesis family protein
MDLAQYVDALRKFWWLVVAGALVGGAYGLHNVRQVVPEYRSSVTFWVITTGTPDAGVSGAVQGDQFAQRRVNSYVALLSQERLAARIAADPRVDLTPPQVSRMIAGRGDLDTVLLTADITSTSRADTELVGEVLAGEFVDLVSELETPPGRPATVQLEVVSGPSVRELAPRTRLMVGFPGLVGTVLGLGVALILQLRDTRVHTEAQVQSITGSRVLGEIPFERRVGSTPLLVDSDPTSKFAESFRQLRTNIQFLNVERESKVLVVTSSVAGDGKSVTAANLAVSLDLTGCRTLVIEADLRRPKAAAHFGVPPRSPGLTDVLAGWATLDGALQPWGGGELAVLPSGRLPPNPSELLGSDPMRRLIGQLRSRFEVIIIDTPPLLPVTDAVVAAGQADGVLLVVRAGKTTRHQIERSISSLGVVDAPLLGVVMTMAPLASRSDYRYESYRTQRINPVGDPLRGQSPPADLVTAPQPGELGQEGADPEVDTAPDGAIRRDTAERADYEIYSAPPESKPGDHGPRRSRSTRLGSPGAGPG